MFHRCLRQLAKTKSSTPRRHVLRRPLRRSGSSGSGVTGAARHSSTSRTAARKGAQANASESSVSLPAATGRGGGSRGPRSSATADVGAAAAAEAGDSGAAASLAAHDGVGGASADPTTTSSASSRRPFYRLATAVATVVVPPTTNVYLQGMKHLLTPATPSPSAAFIGGGPSVPSVSIVEEYYTSKKGPLFATAVVAGTNAVKQVSSLVPFCYPTPIQRCSFTFRRRQVPHPPRPAQMPHRVVLRRRTSEPGPQQSRPEYSVLYCFCTVATENKGGVEMEALTGATMASITLYDMLKGLPGAQEDGLSLGEAFVLAKRGGRNDFTKLLMSEPDRPLMESGMRSGEVEMHALPSSSGVASEGSGQSPAGATHASQSAATGAVTSVAATLGAGQRAPTNAAQARAGGEATSEEMTEKEDHHPGAKRVIRRPVPAAATTHDVLDDSAAPGDNDAWWHSSKHEKRLQELYPRRKYGDNARVVPTSPTPMPTGSPAARARTRTNPLETPDSGAEVTAAPAALPAAQPKLASKASVIRDGRAPISGKESVLAALPPKAAGRAKPRGSSGEAGETDDDEDAVEYHSSPYRRVAKKSSRTATPAVEEDDDDDDDDQPAAAAEAAEEADEEAAETTEYPADEAEEEEAAMAAAAKKRRRGAVVTAPSKGHAPVVAARLSLNGKRAQAGHKRSLAELRSEAKRRDASEYDSVTGEEDEAAEERTEEDEGAGEEERATNKSNSAVPTRKAHAFGNLTGKRVVRSAAEFSSRSAGVGSRKQRPGRATPKKSRSQAELDDHDDEDIAPEKHDDDNDNGNDEAGDDGEDAASAATAKRRGKAAVKQIRSAAPRKGGAMRPVRHDSWDAGFTRRSRHSDDEANADEGYDDEMEEEAEAAEEEDGEGEELEDVAPPPSPRNKLKRPLRRAAPKRR
ncbi:hypothetical protein CUR178_04647 [Leishmania enriettii]|uniref:Molybdopterin cofactor biosynthesis C (MoaC) domain-containing protein n=1 Tax=Leishmania enriettii TaxID=5663 RepID=A0A836HCI1_LEIEN|nr:hypothetical protein CUR178_04647 [Leishmania enriettii]